MDQTPATHAAPAQAQPSDDDIAACAPNGTVRSATTCLMLAGFITLLTGAQMVTSVRFNSVLLQLSLYTMIVAGAAAMYLGIRLYRMRAWAAQGGAGLAALLALGMSAWLLFSFSNGLFSCVALFAPPFAIAAAIFCYKSIPAARRASEIRQRLQDAGIELGF